MVATFKSMHDPGVIAGHYDGRVRVYLESQEDVFFFKERWFLDVGETLLFIGSDEEKVSEKGGGGCRAVIRQVAKDQKSGLNAHGIVDRDILLSKRRFDLFFDQDMKDYSSLFGPEIIVLKCWEMENYLLDPEAMEIFLADYEKRSVRGKQVILEEMFKFIDTILELMSANLVLHNHDEKGFSPLFEIQSKTDLELRSKVKEFLEQKLSGISRENSIQEQNDFRDRFCKIIQQITTRNEADWNSVRYILDGKMFLKRFFYSYSVKHDPGPFLATWIKNNNRISQELVDHIERLQCCI